MAKFSRVNIGHLFKAKLTTVTGTDDWLFKKVSSKAAKTVYGAEEHTFAPDDEIEELKS